MIEFQRAWAVAELCDDYRLYREDNSRPELTFWQWANRPDLCDQELLDDIGWFRRLPAPDPGKWLVQQLRAGGWQCRGDGKIHETLDEALWEAFRRHALHQDR